MEAKNLPVRREIFFYRGKKNVAIPVGRKIGKLPLQSRQDDSIFEILSTFFSMGLKRLGFACEKGLEQGSAIKVGNCLDAKKVNLNAVEIFRWKK